MLSDIRRYRSCPDNCVPDNGVLAAAIAIFTSVPWNLPYSGFP
jgi:hypothetical protein